MAAELARRHRERIRHGGPSDRPSAVAALGLTWHQLSAAPTAGPAGAWCSLLAADVLASLTAWSARQDEPFLPTHLRPGPALVAGRCCPSDRATVPVLAPSVAALLTLRSTHPDVTVALLRRPLRPLPGSPAGMFGPVVAEVGPDHVPLLTFNGKVRSRDTPVPVPLLLAPMSWSDVTDLASDPDLGRVFLALWTPQLPSGPLADPVVALQSARNVLRPAA